MRTSGDGFFDLDEVRRLVGKWSVDCGARVTEWRQRLGWDRQRLAHAAGCTEATIHRIESGKLHPRDHLKLAVAAALEVEVADIWEFPKRSDVLTCDIPHDQPAH